MIKRWLKYGLALMVGSAIICILFFALSFPIYMICVLYNSIFGWI